jgi:hypothetical protein
MSCSTCYEVALPACRDVITVKAGLSPNNQVTWVITDKFGTKYRETVDTDGSGNFEIDTTVLPDDLLNPHAGTFTLEILNSAGQTQTVTFEDEEYTCISMRFYEDSTPEVYAPAEIPAASNSIASATPEESFFVQQIEYTAAENIAQYNVIDSDSMQADSGDVAQANKILALSMTTTNTGLKGVAVVAGMVINPAWTWTIDADIYLNGTTLSETAPLIGFAIVIGKATRADAIVVNIGTPTLL